MGSIMVLPGARTEKHISALKRKFKFEDEISEIVKSLVPE